MYLPNDIIEYIAYMADIDARLALNIQPKKISEDQKNLNIKFKNIMFFDNPYIVLTIYGKSSITRLKIIQGLSYKTEIHKTSVSMNGTNNLITIAENYNIN